MVPNCRPPCRPIRSQTRQVPGQPIGNTDRSAGAGQHATIAKQWQTPYPTNAGLYSVMVSNPISGAASTNARLSVILPPSITEQPQSQWTVVGGKCDFTVDAQGSPPLRYQWWFNGLPIARATNSTLHREDLTLRQAGKYRVVINNMAGSASSDAVQLTVFQSSSQGSVSVSMNGASSISKPLALVAALHGTNSLRVTVLGFRGDSVRFEESDDLIVWRPVVLTTNEAGIYEFIEADLQNGTGRFFRAVRQE